VIFDGAEAEKQTRNIWKHAGSGAAAACGRWRIAGRNVAAFSWTESSQPSWLAENEHENF
jgi:hypothetical protein